MHIGKDLWPLIIVANEKDLTRTYDVFSLPLIDDNLFC